MLAGAGPGVLALEGCVRRVDFLGPRHVAPCLRSTCAEVRLEDVACWPLWVGKERGVVGVALGHDPRLCWGDIHYGDGGPHEAQGVHLACRVSLDVGVRGHEWPLLIAVAIVSRFMGSGTVEAIGAAAGVGIEFTCGVGIGFEENIIEVEVGGTIIGRGPETAASAVSVVVLHALCTSSS